MKIRIKEFLNKKYGIAFTRISKALHQYSPPEFEWVDGDYDISLIHVVGGEEVEILENAKNPIIFQQCYETTDYKNIPWDMYWENALLNIAFRDLTQVTAKKIRFFHTPLGADPDLFFYNGQSKPLKVFTTGHVANTEHIDTLADACLEAGVDMYHTGEDFKFNNPRYFFTKKLDDIKFANLLRRVQYVSCLRETEGFELAGVEGLFCGAVPIVPDLHTYQWYRGFARFVDFSRDIKEQLVEILKEEPTVDLDLIDRAVQKFNWRKIITNIFTEIGKYI